MVMVVMLVMMFAVMVVNLMATMSGWWLVQYSPMKVTMIIWSTHIHLAYKYDRDKGYYCWYEIHHSDKRSWSSLWLLVWILWNPPKTRVVIIIIPITSSHINIVRFFDLGDHHRTVGVDARVPAPIWCWDIWTQTQNWKILHICSCCFFNRIFSSASTIDIQKKLQTKTFGYCSLDWLEVVEKHKNTFPKWRWNMVIYYGRKKNKLP